MIDFHCHLDLYPRALQLLPQVQRKNKFTFIVTTSPKAFVATSKVFASYSNLHVGLGLHPEVAEAKSHELDMLIDLVKSTHLIGEIGLDGTSRFKHTLPIQERIFRAVLNECKMEGGRILSIHSRGAESHVLDLLIEAPTAGVAVLHWFSGNQRELNRAIDMGAWFSVGPAMLRGKRGCELATRMPRNRVLPESDGPFTQINGRPQFPWEAWEVCKTLSQLWNMHLTEVEEQMIANLNHILRVVDKH